MQQELKSSTLVMIKWKQLWIKLSEDEMLAEMKY